jgi:hypothetical protein
LMGILDMARGLVIVVESIFTLPGANC